jgi:hypothetical protein
MTTKNLGYPQKRPKLGEIWESTDDRDIRWTRTGSIRRRYKIVGLRKILSWGTLIELADMVLVKNGYPGKTQTTVRVKRMRPNSRGWRFVRR